MQIQFFGAAQSVTGSMHCLTINGENILLDCGLFQGKRQESIDKNKNFLFDPKSISTLILSHAHIDHSGNIPQLVKQGFTGNIFCTHATQDLINVMLRDSAHIQEKDAEFINKRNRKKGLPLVEPLYNMTDVDTSLTQSVGLGYNRPFMITPMVKVTFYDAGHIFGSAIVVLDVEENGQHKRITFTGDLGRKDLPVIKDPYQVTETNIYITESTYGNRKHDPIQDMKAELLDVVLSTINRGGKVIVPSFSLGRTQELVYFLHELFNEKKLSEIPIYVDSPLSVNITEVFRLHPECFDEETRESFISNHEDPFGFYRLRYIRNTEESKALNTSPDPCIIISASGMCEAGRILHHLANNISDSKNTVLTVGFMAENTLGRRLIEKRSTVKIFGEEISLKAEVKIMNGFSAHADKHELLTYFKGLDQNKLEKVFIVHGEAEQSLALADTFKQNGCQNVFVPKREDKYEL